MRNLMLFEEFNNYKFTRINNTEYRFTDTKENEYKIFFDGPYPDFERVETGVTYELEFVTNQNDYKILTNAGEPFSVSNFIFGDILKDFIRNNVADTIVICPTDVYEDVPRSSDKSDSRYKLYLRSVHKSFDNKNWEVLSVNGKSSKNIVLINKYSNFWKKNSKNKLEALNELKIISNKSSSGRTIELDTILDIPDSNRTLSSKVLLRKKLEDEEAFSNADKEIPFGLKKELHHAYVKYPYLSVAINNLNFLKDTLREKKELRCEYCDKGPLIIYDNFFIKKEDSKYIKYSKFQKIDGATCDHKNPICRGGEKYLYTNLAVCCSRCNKLKKDMSYKDWIENLNFNLSKTLPNKKYKSILQKLRKNRLFTITNLIDNKSIEIEVNPGFDYIDPNKIVKLISKGQGVNSEQISDKKYSISFTDEEILESSKFLNNTNIILDLFLEISEKYKIKKVPSEDWFASYDGDYLQNHFVIKAIDEYTPQSNGRVAAKCWLFCIYVSTRENDNVAEIEKNIDSFKKRLIQFQFRITDYKVITYDFGYENSFFIKREE